MFDIDHPPLVKKKTIVEVCRALHIFFFHVENRLGIIHFACQIDWVKRRQKLTSGMKTCEESQQQSQNISSLLYLTPSHLKFLYTYSHQKNDLDISYQLKRSDCIKGDKSLVRAVHL